MLGEEYSLLNFGVIFADFLIWIFENRFKLPKHND